MEVHNIKASKKHVERPVSVLSAESLDKGGVKVTQGSWKDWLCGVLKL